MSVASEFKTHLIEFSDYHSSLGIQSMNYVNSINYYHKFIH